MGRAIFYCVQCSKRVSDTDLENLKAFRVGDRILCKACAPDSVKSQTTKKTPTASTSTRTKSAGTSVTMKSVSAPIPATPPAEAPAGRSKMLLIGGGAAAAVLIAIVLFFVFRSAPAPAKPPVDVPDTSSGGVKPPTTTDQKPVDPKEAASKADLEKAREFSKTHPDDLPGRLKEYNELVWRWEGTDVARESAKEAAVVKALIMDKVGGWMAELEQAIKPMLDAKQFHAAVKKIEELKPTHDLPEWRLAAEKRASELYVLGRRMAEESDAKKLDEKTPLIPEGKDKPAAKALSEEGKGYQAKWDSAAARATARDFAGAALEVEQALPGLKEADLKAEAEDDLALFRQAGAVAKASLDYLRQRPRGGGLSVGYRDAGGAVKRAGGAVLQIDAERVELRAGKGSVFIDWADVTSSTLAEIARQGKFDPRTLAALCLVEGEAEAAREYKAELGAKWWAYAEGARAKLPKADPAERSAREVYAAAEKSYRTMDTRGAAIDGYRSLRNDYGATALVKLYAERIFRRSDAGREYYWAPADFAAEGTLKLAKSGKLESVKDSDDRDTLLNFAELDFAALAGQTYRCWILVGACCEETFLFYYQGSELTDTDPKTKKKLACEPGTNYAVSVKHGIRNLKKLHDDHKPKGAKVHPKTAARWEWVEITLPKYAGPGGKKLRFMTNQAGFSIGGAVVSATRKAPPAEAEIKELEKARSLDDPPMPVDPDLVAWWTFDEGGGDQAIDLSGKGHLGKLVGDAKWTEGRIGGAVQVAGNRSGIEVADAEDLRVTGDLTLAIWVRKAAEVGDWVCILGRGTPAQRNFGIWLEAKSKKYMFQQFGGADINVYGQKLVETGQWVHLAVTIEGDMIRVFHNGAPDGQQARTGKPWAGPAPLGIGYAMQHTALTGAVDDVRIYRRALSADEIKAVYDLGK